MSIYVFKKKTVSRYCSSFICVTVLLLLKNEIKDDTVVVNVICN